MYATDELPLRPLLQAQGVQVLDEPSQLAQTLGLRVDDGPGVRIKVVLDGSPAAAAGLAAGDG